MTDLASLGFGGGQIIGQQADDAAIAAANAAKMSALMQQHQQGVNAAMPDELKLRQAQARKMNAEADASEIEVAGKKRMLEAIAQWAGKGTAETAGGSSNPRTATLAAPMIAMAEIAMNAGDFKSADSYYKNAAEVMHKEAQTVTQRFTQEKTALESLGMRSKIASRHLNAVTDEVSFARAEQDYQRATGESLFDGQAYSPALVDYMKRGTVEVQKQVDQDIARRTRDLQEQKEAREAALDGSRRALMDARTRAANARADAIGKNDGTLNGKPVGEPSQRLTDHATTLLKKAFPDLKGAELADARYEIAARAKSLMQANRIDAGEATRQAMATAVEQGDLQTVETPFTVKGVSIPFTSTKEVKYKAGNTPQTPMALPPDRKVVKGKYYNTPMGVAQYLGGGKFADPTAPAQLRRDVSADEEIDDALLN